MSAENPQFPAAPAPPLRSASEASIAQQSEIQSNSPEETFEAALEKIRQAAWSVARLSEAKLKGKMSNTRENGIVRELRELEKVLSRLGPQESYPQSVIRNKPVIDK